MALPEPAPSNTNSTEHDATVCIPCPKCGEVIRSFAVQKKDHRRDTATIQATCPNCDWHAATEAPACDLGMTSLALPLAPAPAREGSNLHSNLDGPIFPDTPAMDDGLITRNRAEMDTDTRMTETEWGGLPMHALPSARAPSVFSVPTPLRRHRSRRDAWLLTVACLVALAGGTLELIFVSYRMSVMQIVMVAAVLLPLVCWFLVHGLREVWRTTQHGTPGTTTGPKE